MLVIILLALRIFEDEKLIIKQSLPETEKLFEVELSL